MKTLKLFVYITLSVIIICLVGKVSSQDRDILNLYHKVDELKDKKEIKEIKIPFNFLNNEELEIAGIDKYYTLNITDSELKKIQDRLSVELEKYLTLDNKGQFKKKEYNSITHTQDWLVFTIIKPTLKELNKTDEELINLCCRLSVKYHLAQFEKLTLMFNFETSDGKFIETRNITIGGN